MTQALPRNFDDLIAREVIRHSIDLQRFGDGTARAALNELVRLDRVLTALITTRRNNTRFKILQAMAREEIDKAFDAAQARALRDMERLIRLEAAATAAQLNAVIQQPVAVATLGETVIKAVRDRSLVLGAPSKEWWARQKRGLFNKFSDIVRSGYVTGKTNQQLVAEWRALFPATRREAVAHVRTGIMATANATRMEMYKNSPDVVLGLRTLSTLDLRTSALCRGRSGMRWTLEGEPLVYSGGMSDPWPGPPPWHWNCRTVLVPILKIDETFTGTQASMSGPVAGDLTYDDWFRGLTEGEQIEVLGKRKHELWKQGKLSMREMIDQTGRPLTIEQLESRLAG